MCRARGICALQVKFSLNPKACHPVGSIYKVLNDPFPIASPTVIRFKAPTLLAVDKVEVHCGTSLSAARHCHLRAHSLLFSEIKVCCGTSISAARHCHLQAHSLLFSEIKVCCGTPMSAARHLHLQAPSVLF